MSNEERPEDTFFFQPAGRASPPPPPPPQTFYAPPLPHYSYGSPPIRDRPSFLPNSDAASFRFPNHSIARDPSLSFHHHLQHADPLPNRPSTAPDFPLYYDTPVRRESVPSVGAGRRTSTARRAEARPDAELREEKRRRNAESSQRHRDKQRSRLTYLEGRVAELEQELERARAQGNAEVRDEVIARLQQENCELRMRSREDSSSGKEGSPSSSLSLNSPPLDFHLPAPFTFAVPPPTTSSSSSQPYNFFSSESRHRFSTAPNLVPTGSTIHPTDSSLDDESDLHRRL